MTPTKIQNPEDGGSPIEDIRNGMLITARDCEDHCGDEVFVVGDSQAFPLDRREVSVFANTPVWPASRVFCVGLGEIGTVLLDEDSILKDYVEVKPVAVTCGGTLVFKRI